MTGAPCGYILIGKILPDYIFYKFKYLWFLFTTGMIFFFLKKMNRFIKSLSL